MFLNKDGYAKSVEIEVPSQNLEIDPRGKSSFRGKSYVAKGDSNPVKGTGAARKQKDVTWY